MWSYWIGSLGSYHQGPWCQTGNCVQPHCVKGRERLVLCLSIVPQRHSYSERAKDAQIRHLTTCLTHNFLLAAAQYNVPKFTSEAMDVITDPEVDAVWICSPSSFHADQIKAAAANGKHVFCEKPIATDLPETVEAINACAEAGVKIMIGLQRRFDQNFKRVQQAVVDKEVGEPIQVRRREGIIPASPFSCCSTFPTNTIITLSNRLNCAPVTLVHLHSNTSKEVAVSSQIWLFTIWICLVSWLERTPLRSLPSDLVT